MTSRQRMLTAMRNQQADRVPVAPDISNMIPCRLTGRPFWDIYLHQDPPLWRAYIDAVRYFRMDGWFIYGHLDYQTKGDQRSFSAETVSTTAERIVVHSTCHTAAGDLWSETTYYVGDPPTATRKWIKDLPADLAKLRYLFPPVIGYDDAPLRAMRAELGEDGALGLGVGVPGFQELFGWFDTGLEGVSYAYYDHHDLLAELVAMQSEQTLRRAEMALEAKPDFILLGASGLWTLNTPAAFREFSLPVMQQVCRLAQQAGIPTMLHSCGKERQLVEICARETELDCINPLEPPPMGDCELGEIKREFGSRLALMGNLHTTDVMLRGTPAQVEAAACQAMADAAAGGGFILSTGDQCGRDTPFENIRALVAAAREYGGY